MNHKILGVIPARNGSTEVPGKHMKRLGSKPLIQYTIESALQSSFLDTIALSTDSSEIIQFVSQFQKIEIPFQRPPHLAANDTPTAPVLQHILSFYEGTGQYFDYVCLLQATTPFRCNGLIDKAIQHLLDTNANSLVSVREVPAKYNPAWCYHLSQKNRLQPVYASDVYIPRRQDLPKAYHRDGQIYLAATALIREGYLFNTDTIGFINECGPEINIDTIDDWHEAQNWLSHGK